jgi:3(or 17)beta-hydroxysteroid dehydrogenase
MGRVDGKVVLVTGAGSGIGRATARLLAREGATVIVTDVNQTGGEETVRQIGGQTGARRARFALQDTSKEADWQHVIADILAREGRLDGLVNNAGILGPSPSYFESESLETWQRLLAINTQGVFLGCKHAVPAMRGPKEGSAGGSIVNLSSLAALQGTPTFSAYGASKGAVRQFTKTVAMDCARKGYKVRCNSVHPGVIQTPMGDTFLVNDGLRKRMQAAIPVGEFGAPEDIAWGILYLISDESRYVTGSELVIDGGIHAA